MKDIKLTFKHLQLELDNYCRDVQRIYKEKLIKDKKQTSGELLNNFSVSAKFENTEIIVQVNAPEYFKYVEEGRSPGKQPPPESIQKWIQVKGITPTADKNGKLPTEKSLAYLIGRKIGQEGIKPGNQLANTVEELKYTYQKRFKDALQLDFNDYSLQLIKEIHNMLNK